MTIADARKLAMKVLKQTMDSTLLQPEKVEMCEVAWSEDGKAGVAYRVLNESELAELCDQANMSAAQKEK
jgi:20S proteasome subunit alpha 3